MNVNNVAVRHKNKTIKAVDTNAEAEADADIINEEETIIDDAMTATSQMSTDVDFVFGRDGKNDAQWQRVSLEEVSISKRERERERDGCTYIYV